MYQDMIVSILPGGQPGSAWRQPHQQVALAMRLLIFAVGGVTAYAVSRCDYCTRNMQPMLLYLLCLACLASCPVARFVYLPGG